MKREQGPLAPGVVARFQRITAAKSPKGNYVLELHEDGSVRLARHSGATGDWRTPMDAPLPSTPNGKAGGFGGVRKLRKQLDGIDAGEGDGGPKVVEGEKVKDGVYEIVTVPPGREVVYVNADNDVLRALRKLADGVRS